MSRLQTSILFLLALISGAASAEIRLSVGFHNIYELESNGVQYQRITVPGIEAGYLVSPDLMVSGEFRQISESDGNSTFQVSQERYELMGWVQYLGRRRPSWQSSIGLGAGWNYQKVKTRLYSESRTDVGTDYFKLGARVGYLFWFNDQVFLEGTGQFHWWNSNPGRSWLLGALVGFRF